MPSTAAHGYNTVTVTRPTYDEGVRVDVLEDVADGGGRHAPVVLLAVAPGRELAVLVPEHRTLYLMTLGSPSPTLAPPDLVPEVEPRHPGVGRVPLRHLHPALEEHLLGILDRHFMLQIFLPLDDTMDC